MGEADARAVEARIARELARVADLRPTVACDEHPPPYVRRHLAEHAAEGGVLTDHTVPDSILPYIDPVRLRAAARGIMPGQQTESLPLLPVIRQVSHQWDFACPAHNAAAMSLHAALAQRPLTRPVGGIWHVRWASRPTSGSEIL